MAILVWLVVARGRSTCARCAILARRGVAVPARRRWSPGTARWRCWSSGCCQPDRRPRRRRLLSAHMAPAPADRRPRARRCCWPGCATRCWPSSSRATCSCRSRAGAGCAAAFRDAAPAARGAAGLRAGALQLALLDLLRGGRAPPARPRAPARVASSPSACSCGGRRSSPSAGGCAASCGRSATSSPRACSACSSG